MPAAPSASVFINCPFDKQYQPIFDATVFCVVACGFEPRCTLELTDAGEVLFFFSSRLRHTRSLRDWSSDVCSSDLYLLGIECDGQAFGEAATARDRERLRREVLERLGWRIHRVWSTDWIVATDAEAARVVEAVEAARRARDGLDVDETPLAGLKPEGQRYQGYTRPHAVLGRFQETGARSQES